MPRTRTETAIALIGKLCELLLMGIAMLGLMGLFGVVAEWSIHAWDFMR